MKKVAKILKWFLSVVGLLLMLIILLFGHRDKTVEELSSRYAEAPSAFVEIDGMAVHYRDEGDPRDSLPLVLIHGTSSSLHTFDAWVQLIKPYKRVVRMDLPGFGLTGPFPDRNYHIDHYIDFLEKFLKARDIEHCILGGNSLGGYIAWEFALAKPKMTDKLILIDAAGYPQRSASVPVGFALARTPFLNKLLTYITPRFLVRSSVENVYADKSKVSDTLVDRYFDLTLRAGNRQALVDRMKSGFDTLKVPQIKNIQAPTLVLWGAQDLLIPVDVAYRFHEDLPHDTLVILDQNGHVPMEESPEESVKAVLRFIGEKP